MSICKILDAIKEREKRDRVAAGMVRVGRLGDFHGWSPRDYEKNPRYIYARNQFERISWVDADMWVHVDDGIAPHSWACHGDMAIYSIDPLDDGDFASDDWIEGQALQAAGLPQLED